MMTCAPVIRPSMGNSAHQPSLCGWVSTHWMTRSVGWGLLAASHFLTSSIDRSTCPLAKKALEQLVIDDVPSIVLINSRRDHLS